jgi:hypothetical protein
MLDPFRRPAMVSAVAKNTMIDSDIVINIRQRLRFGVI